MSFRDQVAEKVNQSSSNSGSDDREELEGIDVDTDETPFVKFTPTTMPTFTFPENEGNPVILFKDSNRISELGDAGTDENGRDLRLLSTRYLGLVVDDVGAMTNEEEGFDETVIARTGEDDSTDYRIFDLSDEETQYKYDGAAIEHGDRTYDVAEEVDSIEGRAILVVDRTASTSVARTLDVRGGPTAGMDERTGQVNDGLVEYAPDDVNPPDNGRYARPFVELRDELYGTEVGIMVTRRSEVDEEFADTIEEDDSRNDMLWYTVFNAETGEILERGDYGEPVVDSYLQWNFDEDIGHLPEEDWEFVQDYVEAGMPEDEETILENIDDNSDELSEDPQTERMVTLIQNSDSGEKIAS